MKRFAIFESLRQWLPTRPRISPIGVGAPLQFASSGGGGGGNYDEPEDDYFDDEEPEERPARQRRNADRQATAGRQRTVQTDPDDRYWTDYLRIALPVIGLLLVIAVFWYWAQQLIDDPEDDLTPTEPGLAEVIGRSVTPPADDDAVASPTVAVDEAAEDADPTEPPQVNPQQAIPSPTPSAGEDQPDAGAEDETGTDNQVDQQPDPDPADEQVVAIAPDTEVTVTDGPLRMRSEPSTESEIVTELNEGDILTVLDGPEESGGFTWWPVVEMSGGNQGWVADDFIEPAT